MKYFINYYLAVLSSPSQWCCDRILKIYEEIIQICEPEEFELEFFMFTFEYKR